MIQQHYQDDAKRVVSNSIFYSISHLFSVIQRGLILDIYSDWLVIFLDTHYPLAKNDHSLVDSVGFPLERNENEEGGLDMLLESESLIGEFIYELNPM